MRNSIETEEFAKKGKEFLGKRKYEEALKYYKKTIETDPEYAHAWNNKGNALIDLAQ